MARRARSRALAVWFALSVLATQAAAVTDEEIFRDFRFNFINPGARSMALGGAFIALADDATAAQANPAGLSYLRRQEYFFELRAVDNGARSSVIRERLPAGVDTFVASARDLEDLQSVSFLSAVVPLGRWTVGVSRQEVLNSEATTSSVFAFQFPDFPGVFLVEGAGFIDVRSTNYNVSAGFRVSDRLAFGGSLVWSSLDVRSRVDNRIIDTDANLAPCEILEPTLDLGTTTADSDDDLTFNLGMLFRPTLEFGLGVVYRRGGRFAVTERLRSGPDPCGGSGAGDLFGVLDRLGNRIDNEFRFPDSYGIGSFWRVNDRLTLSGDLERIWYSNLLSGFVGGLNVLTGPDATFTVDDALDIRLGAEYILFPKGGPPLALRGGAYTEADSTIRAVDTGSQSFASEGAFPGRSRLVHVTAGLGIVWPRWKVDIAADLTDEAENEYVISVIFQGKP